MNIDYSKVKRNHLWFKGTDFYCTFWEELKAYLFGINYKVRDGNCELSVSYYRGKYYIHSEKWDDELSFWDKIRRKW